MIKSNASEWIAEVEQILRSGANPNEAFGMSAYMKSRFPFLGIKKPIRKAMLSTVFSEMKRLPGEEIKESIELLFALREREFHYVAIDLAIAQSKKWGRGDLSFLENMIVTHSWWDTVDLLATRCVGDYFLEFPEEAEFWARERIVHPDMWLRRTALLFQLKYKSQLNFDLLSELILSEIDSKEFFIQKAIGWVLREYAKTYPNRVLEFVGNHPVKPLSKREALKHLSA